MTDQPTHETSNQGLSKSERKRRGRAMMRRLVFLSGSLTIILVTFVVVAERSEDRGTLRLLGSLSGIASFLIVAGALLKTVAQKRARKR